VSVSVFGQCVLPTCVSVGVRVCASVSDQRWTVNGFSKLTYFLKGSNKSAEEQQNLWPAEKASASTVIPRKCRSRDPEFNAQTNKLYKKWSEFFGIIVLSLETGLTISKSISMERFNFDDLNIYFI